MDDYIEKIPGWDEAQGLRAPAMPPAMNASERAWDRVSRYNSGSIEDRAGVIAEERREHELDAERHRQARDLAGQQGMEGLRQRWEGMKASFRSLVGMQPPAAPGLRGIVRTDVVPRTTPLRPEGPSDIYGVRG